MERIKRKKEKKNDDIVPRNEMQNLAKEFNEIRNSSLTVEYRIVRYDCLTCPPPAVSPRSIGTINGEFVGITGNGSEIQTDAAGNHGRLDFRRT